MYDIRGVSQGFIKVYSAIRSQNVCFGVVKSPIRYQRIGVIQGSKTGPFFVIYLSDFARMCSDEESILCAEDTVLVYVRTTLDELTDHINSRLRNKQL